MTVLAYDTSSVWMATMRRGIPYHRLAVATRGEGHQERQNWRTLCGRSTRAGIILRDAEARHLGALPCPQCWEVPLASGAAVAVPSWTLVIPAPARWLNLNNRRDRRTETPDRSTWRDTAGWRAKQAKLPHLQHAHITATLRFRENRVRRDPHNYTPTLKAVIDGLVDVGLLPDDDATHLIGPDIRLGEPGKPAVELLIEAWEES